MQNLAVLVFRMQYILPEVYRVNSPCWGCVLSLVMLLALVRKYLSPMSCIEGREVSIIKSVVWGGGNEYCSWKSTISEFTAWWITFIEFWMRRFEMELQDTQVETYMGIHLSIMQASSV